MTFLVYALASFGTLILGAFFLVITMMIYYAIKDQL